MNDAAIKVPMQIPRSAGAFIFMGKVPRCRNEGQAFLISIRCYPERFPKGCNTTFPSPMPERLLPPSVPATGAVTLFMFCQIVGVK